MTQTSLNFTWPSPGVLFKPKTQNYRLLERLQHGPVTNIEIIHALRILNSTGRISEVREALRPYLVDVHAERVPGRSGIFVYSLKGGV